MAIVICGTMDSEHHPDSTPPVVPSCTTDKRGIVRGIVGSRPRGKLFKKKLLVSLRIQRR